MSNFNETLQALSPTCAELNGNDDLLGIGVRITFYLQIILTAIIALLPGADFIGSSWGISATFWALFFCSIIQWSQDKYTLFQAIITSYLLYLHALASTLCAVPCYARPIGVGGDETVNSTSPMILISVALSHLASGIFGIFTAIKGSSMSPSVECNDSTRLQILFFRLKPAGSHRWILFTFAILYLGICCTFQCFQLAIWVKKGRPFTPNWLVLTWKHFSDDPNVVNMIGKSANEDLENRMKDFLMIGGAIWWLSILNIELTIRINEVDTPSASGFGQTLALFTIAIPLEAIARWMAFKNIEMKHQGGNLRQRTNQAMAWIADLVIVVLLGPVLLVTIYAYKGCRCVREKWYARRNIRNGGQGRPVGATNGDDDWFQGIDLPRY